MRGVATCRFRVSDQTEAAIGAFNEIWCAISEQTAQPTAIPNDSTAGSSNKHDTYKQCIYERSKTTN